MSNKELFHEIREAEAERDARLSQKARVERDFLDRQEEEGKIKTGKPKGGKNDGQ